MSENQKIKEKILKPTQNIQERFQKLLKKIQERGLIKTVQDKDLTLYDRALLDMITRKEGSKMEKLRKEIEPYIITIEIPKENKRKKIIRYNLKFEKKSKLKKEGGKE